MEQLFLNIIRRIAEAMPELSLVDEDYGQLETQEDTYPVTFPCVLVGNIDTDWEDRPGQQRGHSSFTVRLAVDCYADTYVGSGTEQAITERQQMSHALYKTLSHYTAGGLVTSLVRTKSHDYTAPHGIKVYQHTFTFRQTEEDQ